MSAPIRPFSYPNGIADAHEPVIVDVIVSESQSPERQAIMSLPAGRSHESVAGGIIPVHESGLYVGGVLAVSVDFRTDHVFNVADTCPYTEEQIALLKQRGTEVHLDLQMDDVQHYDLRQVLPTIDEIHQLLVQHKTVLVHCLMGGSRSVVICCLYLIRYQNYTCDEALAYMRKLHWRHRPNPGFVEQMRQMEKDGTLTIKCKNE